MRVGWGRSSFFPLASAHLSLPSFSPWRWQPNPVAPSLSHSFSLHCFPLPRRKMGHTQQRAVIANLARLLPDRAQPSPARSH